MATAKTSPATGFNPTPIASPVKSTVGRTYSDEQIAFFADIAKLDRGQWYEFSFPNVRTAVSLLRSAAGYLTTKMEIPTGVKMRLADGVKLKDAGDVAGKVQFCFDKPGKPRGRAAKAAA